MSKVYIYYLHKGDNIPCYVGKTNNLEKRLAIHKFTKKSQYFIYPIDLISEDEWKFWEEWYISLFKSWGFNLENKTNKGRGPKIGRKCKWSNKISKSLKGKVPKWGNEEIKNRKIRLKGKQFVLGYRYSQEQKNKCREGRRKFYYQYDLKGNFIKEWWATKIEIAKYFNQCPSNLTKFFKGKQKTAYGFVWKIRE